MLSFSVTFCLVRAEHKFHIRLHKNWVPKKGSWQEVLKVVVKCLTGCIYIFSAMLSRRYEIIGRCRSKAYLVSRGLYFFTIIGII
jgi:hypothetical protein